MSELLPINDDHDFLPYDGSNCRRGMCPDNVCHFPESKDGKEICGHTKEAHTRKTDE